MNPFFPKFLKDRNIDKMYLGFNMAIFALFKIITSALNGHTLIYISRLNGCILGSIMVIVYLVGFGMLYFMEDPNSIIYASYVFSVIGGSGNGINISSSMALISSYKSQR